MEIGQLCIKIAGRDSKKKCVIVDVLDDRFVLIDGETRRRKCNIMHLEVTPKVLDVKKGASTQDVAVEFKKMGIIIKETKPKDKTERPRKQRNSNLKKEKTEKKADKKIEKKESKVKKATKEVKKEK